jgi:hypothetical protein
MDWENEADRTRLREAVGPSQFEWLRDQHVLREKQKKELEALKRQEQAARKWLRYGLAGLLLLIWVLLGIWAGPP